MRIFLIEVGADESGAGQERVASVVASVAEAASDGAVEFDELAGGLGATMAWAELMV